MERISWDEYFMQMARLVSKRSTCLRRNVGAVVVMNKRILTTGYNGEPAGLVHADVRGCLRVKKNVPSGQRHELCLGVHAEQNAIVQAAQYGINIHGSTLYCTHQPCVICVKLIINTGFRRICFEYGYPDEISVGLLKEANIEICKVEA